MYTHVHTHSDTRTGPQRQTLTTQTRSRSLQGPSCPPDCFLLFWSHSRKSPSNTSWGSASPVGPLPSLQKLPQPGVHPGGHSSTRLPELSYLSPNQSSALFPDTFPELPHPQQPGSGTLPQAGGLTSTEAYLCSFWVPRGIRNPGQPARKGPNVDSSP